MKKGLGVSRTACFLKQQKADLLVGFLLGWLQRQGAGKKRTTH
jgi:hypothetical protein